jgi:CheY-like chemotaxis protein
MSNQAEFPQTTRDTVLLLEDDVLQRAAIAEYLRDCGYRVIEGTSTDEALVILDEPTIKVDVVFSDAQMPGTVDGFGLAKWIRQHRPDLKMLLTSSAEKAAATAGDLCEEGPHLKKPYEPQQVLDWIKRLRASQRNKD